MKTFEIVIDAFNKKLNDSNVVKIYTDQIKEMLNDLKRLDPSVKSFPVKVIWEQEKNGWHVKTYDTYTFKRYDDEWIILNEFNLEKSALELARTIKDLDIQVFFNCVLEYFATKAV